MAVIIDGKTGRHISKNLSKAFKRFLALPNCTIKCAVIEKSMNHGAGYGLEIAASFKFLEPAKAIQSYSKFIQNYSNYSN